MTHNIISQLKELISIPSPTGDCGDISMHIEAILRTHEAYAAEIVTNKRGHLRFSITGKNAVAPKLTWVGHADTLGVKVNKSCVAENGYAYAWLNAIGSLFLEDVLNKRVKFVLEHKEVTGTILPNNAGPHTGPKIKKKSALWSESEDGFFCRLDSTEALPEDAIGHLEPDFFVNDAGFIVSRHIDSKADVTVMLQVIQRWAEAGYVPPHPVDFVFNMDEEPGIATPMIADDTHTCIALEFIPTELGCKIDDLGVITKDGMAKSTPETVAKIVAAGIKNTYVVPKFGSDVTLAARAGATFNIATIGFGLDKSHGAERTHVRGIEKLVDFVAEFRL